MRKDLHWEPYFFLAFHLKQTSWTEFYNMPVRLRNWLVERTVEEFKRQNDMAEGNQSSDSGHKLEGAPDTERTFKDFKAF